jgi:hypothetical protein
MSIAQSIKDSEWKNAGVVLDYSLGIDCFPAKASVIACVSSWGFATTLGCPFTKKDGVPGNLKSLAASRSYATVL